MSNKMFIVDVHPTAPWASSPAYVRAGSRVEAIRVYMEDLTWIAGEGDLGVDDISCVSFPDCPVKLTTLISWNDEIGGELFDTAKDFPGKTLLPARMDIECAFRPSDFRAPLVHTRLSFFFCPEHLRFDDPWSRWHRQGWVRR